MADGVWKGVQPQDFGCSEQRRGKHFGSSEIIQILAIRNRFRMDLSCIQKFSAEINEIASFIQDKIIRKIQISGYFYPKKGPKNRRKRKHLTKMLIYCYSVPSISLLITLQNFCSGQLAYLPELSEIDAKLAEIQPKLRLFLNVSEINHPKF